MQRRNTGEHTGSSTAILTPKRCLIAAAAFYVLMIVVGAIPGNAEAMSNLVVDKLLHFAAYALLTGLLYAALPGEPPRRALWTLAIAASLGTLDEAIQALIPYRNANWIDWKFDMLASLTCVGILMVLHPLYATLAARQAALKPVAIASPRSRKPRQ